MKRFWLWAPLIGFVIFFAVVASGLLKPGDRAIASKMVGKPLPAFDLPAGAPGRAGLSSRDFAQGGPRLLNVFASWCVPCIAEAPVLMELKRRGVTIDAIAIRDRPEDVAAFLARNGDPYDRIGSDTASRVQLALGSSGVPETFVIDGKGVIRHQHIGDIRPENVAEIFAELEKAR
ncbi:DsbE family thiol:disulfide interchange protein [Sphingomonas sp. ID1715]|uniref:DsbE family thiol:disulfide interchange protein n=1 Tax=Sphingomonas sp. ID1715 TaxID=1656898 RepID=UPI00148782BE|nr:DsbE family thiol:disulfide interchange protein [Sphingomonas sp. ID1715]NNM77893.1 DsbE family thiol:disulfide interchange protein [Sphingomonas sp. ID1715]